MFPKKTPEKTDLDLMIEEALVTLSSLDVNSDEYTEMFGRVTDLMKLRATAKAQKSISPDTIALIAANLAGILMIIGYEQTHVITTKAMSFVGKTLK